jgi:hypothetical protein
VAELGPSQIQSRPLAHDAAKPNECLAASH